jgi:HNH endonuclease
VSWHCAVGIRKRRSDGTVAPIDPEDWSEFWSLIDAFGDCWIFTGTLTKKGYGRYRGRFAHRVALKLLCDIDVPPGYESDHLCRVHACCNPDHIEVVTQRENWLRGYTPSAIYARRTTCLSGHSLTPDNLIKSKRQRICKQCRNIYQQGYRAARL